VSQILEPARGRFFSPLLTKAVTIGVLLLVLLIALSQVDDLRREREGAREVAIARVTESLGGAQTVGGVLLNVPTVTTYRADNKTRDVRRVEHVLPDTLKINVTWVPEIKRSGLYAVPTYVAEVEIVGNFAARDLARLRSAIVDRQVRFDSATLTILNSESRTLRSFDTLTVAGNPVASTPGGYADFAGVEAALPEPLVSGAGDIPFRAKYRLVGSEALRVLPLARAATVSMTSAWPHPKFVGKQSPIEQNVRHDGFTAQWTTLDLARDFGQAWTDDDIRPGLLARDAFLAAAVGVEQYQPVDVYQRNYRAVHYAMLLIGLTFLTFFLCEHMGRMPIHGMQYLFVGLALAVFYVLLLALSEHVEFWTAYLIAASVLVLLITVYLSGVFRRAAPAAIFGGALATLYALMYLILVSEDYSLLMGAIMLCGVLAILMIGTRRFDWSSVGSARPAA
jgi:inner membrane protein